MNTVFGPNGDMAKVSVERPADVPVNARLVLAKVQGKLDWYWMWHPRIEEDGGARDVSNVGED